MRALYLEAFAGISGNMTIGALLDLGVPETYLRAELAKLNLPGYELKISKVLKCGISATYVDVVLNGPESHHHHGGEHMHHQHEHGHDHHHHKHHGQHAQAGHHQHHEHRSLSAIVEIITKSALAAEIKEKAIAVFTKLGQAEAKVHAKPLEEIHFHEVGAVDTIVDIVGSLVCLEWLQIEKIFISKIRTGFGFVKCAHGVMPVPAPATAELLQGLPYYQGEIEKELATPTGVALVSTLAEVSEQMPPGFTACKIGYGAGGYELAIPNTLRGFLGDYELPRESGGKLLVLEANIDDMNPEFYEYLLAQLWQGGALDVWLTPVLMKKSRPASQLSVLLAQEDLRQISELVFQEATTLGVRYYPVERTVLARSFGKIKLPAGEVQIKYGLLDGKIINVAPEYEDCKKLAQKTGESLKSIYQQATQKALADLSN